MKVLDEIKEYLSNDFNDEIFFKLYSFTTENIDGYMSEFNLKDKSLLTIGSSSDQVINAGLAGCDDITVYDICPLTKYFYYLKLSSMLVLNREEFLDFLCKTKYQDNRKYNPHLLTKKTFNKIKNTLKVIDYESYYIWDYLFKNYRRYQLETLFRNDINSFESIVYCNKYLKNDYNYNCTKKVLMNVFINFVNGNISSIKTDKKFDNIWLSNVAQYLDSNEIMAMIENTRRILANDGKILLCYFWNTSMTIKGAPIEEFANVQSNQIIISGISKQSNENSILVYDRPKTLKLNK